MNIFNKTACLLKIFIDICICKTSLSSQTDTKRAVREASLFLSLSCLIACKDRQSFSIIQPKVNVLQQLKAVMWQFPRTKDI